jgi:hypothetical protein
MATKGWIVTIGEFQFWLRKVGPGIIAQCIKSPPSEEPEPNTCVYNPHQIQLDRERS